MTIGENKEWHNIGIYPRRQGEKYSLDLIDANVVCCLIGHKSFLKINTLEREKRVSIIIFTAELFFVSPDDFQADRRRVTVSR